MPGLNTHEKFKAYLTELSVREACLAWLRGTTSPTGASVSWGRSCRGGDAI